MMNGDNIYIKIPIDCPICEVKTEIEKRGGKVTGSVTKSTYALINNDIESNSSKNKKAKELGVQIINEDQLIEMLGM